jgi:hypothetical protein
MKEELIEVRGKSIKEVYRKLDTSFLDVKGFGNFPDYAVYEQNSCSSCMGMVVAALQGMKKSGEYRSTREYRLCLLPRRSYEEAAART